VKEIQIGTMNLQEIERDFIWICKIL